MDHRVEMPRTERRETDGERRQRRSGGCSLEKVADEMDPLYLLIGVRSTMKESIL
jgi:hypothetical protein